MKLININQITGKKEQLFADDILKVYYLTFDKGEVLPHHSLNGIGVIQILEGHITIEFSTGDVFNLTTGDMLEFKSFILHTVKAIEKTKLLLTNASYSN